MPSDNLNPPIQGLAATPDNQLPQLTSLPTPPPFMTMQALSQPASNPLSMSSQAFLPSTSINPTIIPPSASVCGCGFCRLPEIPQRRYHSTQISMETDSRIGETISFSKGGCGIPLRDAVENRLSGLVGGDDLMFDGFNVSAFSLRIEVGPCVSIPILSANRSIMAVAGLSPLDREGTDTIYVSLTNASPSIQFRARNWGGSQGQISRARLGVQVAKRIAEFIAVRQFVSPRTNQKH